jgi:hypothetical protein
MSSTSPNKNKKDKIKLNMTFDEAMKKALSTPVKKASPNKKPKKK